MIAVRTVTILGAAVLASLAQAQPIIPNGGIVNAASYTAASMPGGAIAQGSLFTIFGSGLGPAAPAQAAVFPIAPSLSGVSIKVSNGSTSVDALPFYVSASQVSAIMPSNAPLGSDKLVLTFNGKSNAGNTVQVVASSVGLFAVNSGGSGPSVVQNYVSATQLPVNSRSVSAMPGQTLILYGTGLGAGLNADNVPPLAGELPVNTEIFVGGKQATELYSGRSPCCAGLDQMAFTLTPDVPLGCNVPIQVRTKGSNVSNAVTIAISATGGTCKDTIKPFGDVTSASKSASLLAVRGTVRLNFLGTPVDITQDTLQATFRQEAGGDFAFNPLFSPPPLDSCTGYNAPGNLFRGDGRIPGFNATVRVLGAGNLTVTGPKGTQTVARGPYEYYGVLGLQLPVPAASRGLFLDGGPFTVSGLSGKDVGTFTTTVSPAPAITWTNADADSIVTRANGVTVNWTLSGGIDPIGQVVVIAGGATDAAGSNSALFLCTAAASAGTFTVPPYILQRIPAAVAAQSPSRSALIVGVLAGQPQNTFTATGLDAGSINAATLAARMVTFQ